MDEIKKSEEACQKDDNIDNSSDETHENGSEESSPAEHSTATVTELKSNIEARDLPTNIREENLQEFP